MTKWIYFWKLKTSFGPRMEKKDVFMVANMYLASLCIHKFLISVMYFVACDTSQLFCIVYSHYLLFLLYIFLSRVTLLNNLVLLLQ